MWSVSSMIVWQVKEIDTVLERKVREEVMKILDQRENEYLPQVILDTMEVGLASVFNLYASVTTVFRAMEHHCMVICVLCNCNIGLILRQAAPSHQ